MSKLLWEPSAEVKNKANMTRFISFVNKKHGLDISSYDELYDWSIEKIPDFWAAMWEFVPIKASKTYDEVVDDLTKFPGARWFGGARFLDVSQRGHRKNEVREDFGCGLPNIFRNLLPNREIGKGQVHRKSQIENRPECPGLIELGKQQPVHAQTVKPCNDLLEIPFLGVATQHEVFCHRKSIKKMLQLLNPKTIPMALAGRVYEDQVHILQSPEGLPEFSRTLSHVHREVHNLCIDFQLFCCSNPV